MKVLNDLKISDNSSSPNAGRLPSNMVTCYFCTKNKVHWHHKCGGIYHAKDNTCRKCGEIVRCQCGELLIDGKCSLCEYVKSKGECLGKRCRSEFGIASSIRKKEIKNTYDQHLRKLENSRRKELLQDSFTKWKHCSKKFEMQSGVESILWEIPNLLSNPEVIDIAEDVMIFGYELMRARTIIDYMVSTMSFLKRRIKSPLITTLLRKDVIGFITGFVAQSDNMLLQGGEDFLDLGRNFIEYWPRFKSSPLWRKVSKVVIYATSMSLFDSKHVDGIKAIKVEKEYYRSRAVFNMDFTYTILDLIMFIAGRGHQMMKSGKIDVMFHSGSTYEEWYQASSDIVSKSKFLANPSAHGIDIHQFTKDLDDLIAKGISMYKYACELDKSARNIIRSTTAQLQTVRAEFLNKKNAQKTRSAPFALMIEGHSSIGKTTFANLMHYYYGVLNDKDVSLGCRFTRNPVANFWDGFTSDQWSLLLDDVGFMKPGVSSDLDPTLKEVILIINNAPYCPDMASLEDKGNAPLRVELVTATTNTPDLHLDHYFAVPAAVARRFPYHIRLRPKQHLTKNKTMLDETLLEPILPGMYPDWWNIEILEPEPIPVSADPSQEWKQTVRYVSHKNVDGSVKLYDMKTFLPWIADRIEKHNQVQDKVQMSEMSLQRTQICLFCHLPELMCDCKVPSMIKPIVRTEMQGGTEVYGHISFTLLFGLFQWMCIPLLASRCVSYIKAAIYRWFCFTYFYNLYVDRVHQYIAGPESQVRLVLHRCGEAVRAKLGTPKICYTIVASISVILTSYGIYRWFAGSMKAEGGISSKLGQIPEPKHERESVWRKEDYEVCSFDVGELSTSWNKMDRAQLEGIILRNCGFIRYFTRTDHCKTAKVIGLGGQYFLTTAHQIPDFSGTMNCQITRSDMQDCINSNISFSISKNDLDIDLDNDLAIIRIRNVPPLRNIIPMFAREKMRSYKGEGFYVGRNSDGTRFSRDVSGIHLKEYKNRELNRITRNWFGHVDVPTGQGDCGAALVIETGIGPAIAGIHQLGAKHMFGKHEVGALFVTQEYLNERLQGKFLISPAVPLFDSESTSIGTLAPLHIKSPVRYIPQGEANVYGSFTGFRTEPKSAVRPSVLKESMEERGFRCKYGKPQMKGWKPWYLALSELTKNTSNIDTSIVDICVNSLVEDWKKVDPKWFKELMVYDNRTVTNGRPGLRYVDRINMRSSAGFPWRKSKKYLIEPEPTELEPEAVRFTPEVMKRVDERIEKYLKHERTFPIFTGCLKDEALKLEKCEAGKTRVFMGAPIDFTFVMRKALLSFVRVMQKNKFIFEAAPGTEAQTVEWDWLYQYLTQHGESQCVFGDFSRYDMTMNSIFVLAAFEVIERFHEYAGCSQEHLDIIRGIAYDVTFCLVDFNGDLIEFFGKNPSGQALTVIINSIVNSLYMRYVYYMVNPSSELDTFKENVNLLTYGDDNGINVSQRAPWFNHCSIQNELAKIGVTYTMADKDALSVPYVSITDGSFLKRKWRFEEETNSFVCPLDEESIIKSLMINVRSKFISPKAQAMETIYSANCEWFWHGRPKFEEMRDMLLDIIREQNLIIYMDRDLETWDELMLRYKTNSLDFLKENPPPNFIHCRYCLEGGSFVLQSGSEESKGERSPNWANVGWFRRGDSPRQYSGWEADTRESAVCPRCHLNGCIFAVFQDRISLRRCHHCLRCKSAQGSGWACPNCDRYDLCERCNRFSPDVQCTTDHQLTARYCHMCSNCRRVVSRRRIVTDWFLGKRRKSNNHNGGSEF